LTLDIQFLPAAQGDAIWLRWGNHQALIDIGTEQTGLSMVERLNQLPTEQRHFDLLVITHVDRDHIGGVLTAVSEPRQPVRGLHFDDVWFNGWDHLHGRKTDKVFTPGPLESMGPVQGERLSLWLIKQSWNEAFEGAAVALSDAGQPQTITLPGDLKVTVLGPTRKRLERLIQTWADDVDEALAKGTLVESFAGLESLGSDQPPVLRTVDDLKNLADTPSPKDDGRANGTSISLLVEFEGRRALLTGDAFADDLVAALGVVGQGDPVSVDLAKLPHHGSRKNVTRPLVEAVDSPRWVFSTNGSIFGHPHPEAVARVVQYARREHPILMFNVPSTSNSIWDNPGWKKLFNYDVSSGDDELGLTVSL
jgi:hypothetical protein